jgi:hypothetical protein
MDDEDGAVEGDGDATAAGATVDGPSAATEEHWKQLVVEMEQSATEHRNAGWETVVCHPAASGVVDDGEPGFGVVVSREEFDALDRAASSHEVDEYEVLRADLPGEIHLLVILYTADGDVALFVPAALEADRLDGLRAVVDGTFYSHVTPPEDDATVSFTHDDPSLFFPGSERPRTARTREGTSEGAADDGGEGGEREE